MRLNTTRIDSLEIKESFINSIDIPLTVLAYFRGIKFRGQVVVLQKLLGWGWQIISCQVFEGFYDPLQIQDKPIHFLFLSFAGNRTIKYWSLNYYSGKFVLWTVGTNPNSGIKLIDCLKLMTLFYLRLCLPSPVSELLRTWSLVVRAVTAESAWEWLCRGVTVQ